MSEHPGALSVIQEHGWAQLVFSSTLTAVFDTCACSRFQPVVVPEPTIEETFEILQGLRERYEVRRVHTRMAYA